MTKPTQALNHDAITAALAHADTRYVDEMCYSAELISRLAGSLSAAGGLLVSEASEYSGPVYLEYYLQAAINYREILAHGDFPQFKANVLEAWFGPKPPNSYLKYLIEDGFTYGTLDHARDWQFRNNADLEQLLRHLALQQVGLMVASAYEGEEEAFIEDDYQVARDEVEVYVEQEEILRLEQQYFLGGDALFAKQAT